MLNKAIKASMIGAMLLPVCAARASDTSSEIASYVRRHTSSSVSCETARFAGRLFLRCAYAPNCKPPNYLFEVRDRGAVWVNGTTGSFVDHHQDHPVPIREELPHPYDISDIFRAFGCARP